MKKSLSNTRHDGQDEYLALLILSTTPGNDKISPTVRLFGHHPLSSLLSFHPDTIYHPEKVMTSTIEVSYNQHARTLPDLQPETVVGISHPGDKR